jgi:hypothetical protein
MNRCRSLLKLRLAFAARIDRLERRLSAATGLAPHERDPIVAYVTIETSNAWAQFSKALYLSCVMNAKTEGRVVVSVVPPGMSANDALGVAIERYKTYATPNSTGQWARRDEPTWHDPNVLLELCRITNCSLYAQMQAAFSLGQRVFIDLPVFRNFYGHRNRLSAAAAQNVAPTYLLPTTLRPSEMLMRPKPASASPVLVEWMAELKITSEFICG